MPWVLLGTLRLTLIRLGLGCAFPGLRCAGFLLGWLLLLEWTPYGAKGFAFAGWMDGEDAAVCLIFKSLCARFLEGETGAAPLPILKADCKLAGCLAGTAVLEARWGPASPGRDSMLEPGLMFASPVKALWPCMLLTPLSSERLTGQHDAYVRSIACREALSLYMSTSK